METFGQQELQAMAHRTQLSQFGYGDRQYTGHGVWSVLQLNERQKGGASVLMPEP